MARRLKRKEMKRPDEILTTLETISEFFKTRWKPVTAIGGVVLVVVLGLLGWRYLSTSNQAKAANLLNEALSPLHTEPGAAEPASSSENHREKYTTCLEKLDTIVDDYKGTRAAHLARYYRGICLLQLGRVDEAATAFSPLAASKKDDLVTNLAELEMARIDGIKGNWEHAASEYERLFNIQARYLPKDLLLLRRAVALEKLARYDDAAQVYRKLLDEFPASPYKPDAERALTMLEEEHGVVPAAEAQAPVEEGESPAETGEAAPDADATPDDDTGGDTP